MGMGGHESASPLKACLKVDDCCDLFFAGKLTDVKMIETCVESIFATECVRSTIVDHFLLFW
jgi:hypothetical protein